MIALALIAWWLEGRTLRRDVATLEQQIVELRAMPSEERAALDLALLERSARNYAAALRKVAP